MLSWSRKGACADDIQLSLSTIAAQLRAHLRKETGLISVAERQLFRGLREKSAAVVQQGAARYCVGNRRVGALEAALAAVAEIGGLARELEAGAASPQLCAHIGAVLVVGGALRMDLQAFRRAVLAPVFSPAEIAGLASPHGVAEAVRRGLFDTELSDAEFDLLVQAVAQNTGIPGAAKPFLRQRQLYPSLDGPIDPAPLGGYRERAHLFVPVALPPFSVERSRELAAAVAAALDPHP
jgi:hypothetical protein